MASKLVFKSVAIIMDLEAEITVLHKLLTDNGIPIPK
jgi:hypothetical protein